MNDGVASVDGWSTMTNSDKSKAGLVEELQRFATANSPRGRSELELPLLQALVQHSDCASPLTEIIDACVDEVAKQAENPAIATVFQPSDEVWKTNLSERQRHAAAQLGMSYDTFRRRRDGNASPYDKLCTTLAEYLLKQFSPVAGHPTDADLPLVVLGSHNSTIVLDTMNEPVTTEPRPAAPSVGDTTDEASTRSRHNGSFRRATFAFAVLAVLGAVLVSQLDERRDPSQTTGPREDLTDIAFGVSADQPSPPTSVEATVTTSGGEPAVNISWNLQDGYSVNIYREGVYHATVHPDRYQTVGSRASFVDTTPVVSSSTVTYYLTSFLKGTDQFSVRSPGVSVAVSGNTPETPQPAADAGQVSTPVLSEITRYSKSNGEIFWERPSTPGLRYEVVFDGETTVTHGTSLYRDGLANQPYSFSVVALLGDNRSEAATGTLPRFG